MPKRIIIVEDEPDVADLVDHYLKKEGFETEIHHNGAVALEKIRMKPPDIIILDLMLPEMDGLEICRTLRSETPTKGLPIIMLTAKSDELDRVLGLEMGADDYITKPFSPKELVARVKAVLRRGKIIGAADTLMEYDGLVLDPSRHRVTCEGKEVHLTAKEFGILEYLLKRPGRVISREQLLGAVWDIEYMGETRTVDVHIRYLRKKIPLLATAIVTVKSFGYKLKETS
jgi:two-component system, OmpR family, alkaline phosphatase synthesis response regulator PhoP